MFCPSCGDIRETVYLIKDNIYRCRICGHVFKYDTLQELAEVYGEGTWED